ncbi:hypothetical protein GCM10020331_070120 [Ectobacillus funiculus]
MEEGVEILDTVTLPCKVTKMSKYVFKIIFNPRLKPSNSPYVCSARLQGSQAAACSHYEHSLRQSSYRTMERFNQKNELDQLFKELRYKPKQR